MPVITRSKTAKLVYADENRNHPLFRRSNSSVLTNVNRELNSIPGSSTCSTNQKNMKRKCHSVYSTENLKRKIPKVKADTNKSVTEEPEVIEKPVQFKSNVSGTQSSSSAYEDCSKVCSTLKRKYVNVIERLKLDFIPFCAKNIDFCCAHHSSNCSIPGKAQFDKIKEISCFTDHKRHLSFLESIEDMCIRSEFPGEELLYSLFETILIVNYTVIDEISSRELIRECILLFHHISDIFPPCWFDVNQSYRNLLRKPVKIKRLLPNVEKSDENIFTFILNMLEEFLSCKEENKNIIPSVDNKNSINMEGTMKEWEEQYTPKQNFCALKREEKIFRLFSLLELITKLLESDLTAWMTRNISKPNKHLYDERQPLIQQVFGINSYQMLTQNVKKFLKIFVNCVQFSYPSKVLSVLSRILSLLCTIFNLSDTSCGEEDKRIIFPSIGKNTESFAREVFNVIENAMQSVQCSGYEESEGSVKGFLSTILVIANPYLKYLLVNYLVENLSPVILDGPMCPKKVADILLSFGKGEWKNCCKERNPIENCHDTSKTSQESTHGTSKYPIIPKYQNNRLNDKSKRYFIYKDEFFKILLEALKSYCETFDIKNIVQIFIKKIEINEENEENPTTSTKRKKRNSKKLINENDALSLDEIERNIEQLEKGINMRHKLNSLPPPTSPSISLNLDEFVMIYVDDQVMLRYRDDIKYLLILRENIPKLQAAFPKEFESWLEFIKRDLFKDT